MLRTLYAKLSLSLTALLVAVGVLYTLLSLSTARYYLQETGQKLNLDLAKNLVADRKLVHDGRINQKALSSTFMEYMVINPSIEIYMLDLDGTILSYSADPGKVKRRTVSLAPIYDFLNGKKPPILGDDPRSHDKQKIFSVTPIPDTNSPQGYLYVVLQGEQYDNAERLINESLLWKQTGMALAGSLLLGLLAGLLLFKKLTRRLDTLSRKIAHFRSNDFSAFDPINVTNTASDEIDRLDTTFSQMAQRIVTQMNELKQQDELRRELVTNVSHDLRTPVAILHGYLETLDIKSHALDPQELKHYVQLALASGNRLNRLITELFELATLEARDYHPQMEPCNLAELVHDVLHKFQHQADNMQITLSLQIPATAIFVHGNIGLIERALENLLGNALEHTPPQGSVEINLAPMQDNILLQVRDSGPGIPAEDLARIFERFYQGKQKSNRTKPGGLGLSITKRIVELHSGTIYVDSQHGRGSTFTIKLPRVINL